MIDAAVRTFQAADARHTSHCAHAMKRFLRWDPTKGSQFDQDIFVWRNLFANDTAHGTKGFYIDSGANAPRAGSNSWFYDRCLGWDGLCIEPNYGYAYQLRRQRSCKVVSECISDKPSNATFLLAGVGGHIADAEPETNRSRSVKSKVATVPCNTLESMLDRHAEGRRDVDFWSLDVEGHERAALRGADLSRIRVRALLIEDDKVNHRALDEDTLGAGYIKLAQMYADSLYVRPDLFRFRGISFPLTPMPNKKLFERLGRSSRLKKRSTLMAISKRTKLLSWSSREALRLNENERTALVALLRKEIDGIDTRSISGA